MEVKQKYHRQVIDRLSLTSCPALDSVFCVLFVNYYINDVKVDKNSKRDFENLGFHAGII